jgi:hypothetical protein
VSLLIGCILIYHYELEWWWYVLSVVMYCAEWETHRRNAEALRQDIIRVEDSVHRLHKPPIPHDD